MKPIFLFLALSVLAQASDLKQIPLQEPSAPKEAKQHGQRVATEIRMELASGDYLPLAKRTDKALDYVVNKAVTELRKKGFEYEADEAMADWNFHYYGFLTEMVLNRDIGDHKPLIQWLANFYDKLESKLGVTACKFLHLSDIKTFNFCIPVVFHACTFDMGTVTIPRKEEYKKHFNADAVYYGLIPVVVYWSIDVPCMFGTAGIAAFLCGPAASAGEWATYKWIGPKLSDRVFKRACGS